MTGVSMGEVPMDDVVRLDLRRWARPADLDERALLAELNGPVLEVGCGPGRLVAALGEQGTPALGIDVAPVAAELAADRGAPMLVYSVFDRLPGEGRWPTVLLLDGSIGIGGDPAALLVRVREVLAPDGLALVEVEGPGVPSGIRRAVVELDRGAIGYLPWAHVGIDDLHDLALACGFILDGVRSIGWRWFGWLRSGRVR
jgi:SAM-dependent methyltransferase